MEKVRKFSLCLRIYRCRKVILEIKEEDIERSIRIERDLAFIGEHLFFIRNGTNENYLSHCSRSINVVFYPNGNSGSQLRDIFLL